MKGLGKNSFVNFIEKYYFVFLAAIFFVAFFNVFYNLNTTPINSWDEARHGVSAYEMLKKNNYVVNTYGYENDYWNLKPPLSFWLISLGYKIAGFNPLGLRLFSAAAAILTIAFTAFFSNYMFGRLSSLISASVLTTTTQFILSHSSRTGDADSLHVMFFTIAVGSAALININKKWLYISGTAFSLSFLTKSWHALSIPVIIVLYLLFSKAILKINLKEWTLFALSSFLPIFIWGIFRYSNDGLKFFKMMISFDLLSRSSSGLEGHTGESSYYLSTLQYGYFIWLLILVGSFITYLALAGYRQERSHRNHILLLLLWIFIPLFFYTTAKTKITWYILPIFPALAISIGVLCSKIIKKTSLNIVLQLLVVTILAFSMYKNEREIHSSIMHIEPDNTQTDLYKMKNLDDYKGVKIYTLCGNIEFPTCWSQSGFLAAELYRDLIPKDGGLDLFIKDNSKVLIMVPNDGKYKNLIENASYKVLAEGNTIYILGKN